MKRIALIFGSISGVFITAMMIYSSVMCYTNPQWESNDLIGYTLLIAAFSFVFVGIKSYRDKHNDGVISFGKAFKTGATISLVASLMYLLVWLVEYYLFIPDFLDHYTQHVLYMEKLDGASPGELEAKATEMAGFAEMYQNPLFVIVTTFLEVFPIGLVITLISALILRRKPETISDTKA